MVAFVSGLSAPPRASTGNENQLTLLVSARPRRELLGADLVLSQLVGTPGSGKRTFAQALAAGKEETGQTLTVQVRVAQRVHRGCC